MIRNYLIVAFRNLLKHKTLSIIKITGLSIGLALCVLMFLYSKDELSFDRFHAHRANIYRLIQDMDISGQPKDRLSITQRPLGEAFAKEIPEVKARCRLLDFPVTIKKGNDVYEENPLTADDNFFTLFSFGLLEGDPKTVLKDMYSIVLSKSAANKYFGSENAMGKIIQLKTRDEFENFKVTGVAADAPQNSSITFSMVVPFSFYQKGNTNSGWIGGTLNTFLLLDPSANLSRVTLKMQQIFDANTKEQIAQAEQQQKIKIRIQLGLQPMDDIHTNKELGAYNGLAEASVSAYSYILSGIAAFILLIACINFINLSLGQSLKRSREIGIRKVVGGSRGQLIRQFLVESFLVSLFAFLLALIIASAILPLFNQLAGKKLSLAYLGDAWLYLGWFALLMITSFLAGIYPALVLSGFNTISVLWGRKILMGKSYLSRSLIVFQFTLAIFLIMATIAIYTQLNFLLNRNLGYDSRNLVRINLPFSDQNDKLVARFKHELSNQPGIMGIAARNKGRMGTGVFADGKQMFIDLSSIDESFLPTLKIPVTEGRNFSPAFPADSVQSAIVNETFVQQAGWKGNAIGKTIENMEDKRKLTIVGVIKDYHYGSLKEKIGAQVFRMGPEKDFGTLWVKIDTRDRPSILSQVAETFRSLSPFYPYSYDFIDTINARNYDEELRWKKIVSISAFLFIFISCIGLLGLVMLSVEQRTKEIGIRKVLGAAVTRIIVLISMEFTWLVLVAFLIALPLAYYSIHRWLENYPYRTSIHWWFFALAGLLMITLAWLTIGFKALKAALANPVNSLRSE